MLDAQTLLASPRLVIRHAPAPATVTHWTDHPVATESPIRAVHVNELRRAIDIHRRRLGIPAYPWTDDPAIRWVTYVRACHFLEIREATQELWNARRMGLLPDWTAGSPPSSERAILALDMNDLRQWVTALAGDSPALRTHVSLGRPAREFPAPDRDREYTLCSQT